MTGQILAIQVKASSAAEAEAETNALASAFLAYKAQQLRTYVTLSASSLDGQITDRKASIAALQSQISTLTGNAAVPGQTSELASLQRRLATAQTTLHDIEFSSRSSEVTTAAGTSTAIRGSYGLGSATPLKHSRVKSLIIYLLSGAFAGAVLGMGAVAVRALLSDRLRRRDDVAHALGASVRLSVGRVRLRRLLPGAPRGLRTVSLPPVQRITGYLRGVLFGLAAAGHPGTPALAVVLADEDAVAARALVGLALSCTEQAKKVMLADLRRGAPAARLLGVKSPGIHQVVAQGQPLTVVVPAREEVTPAGPLPAAAGPSTWSRPPRSWLPPSLPPRSC